MTVFPNVPLSLELYHEDILWYYKNDKDCKEKLRAFFIDCGREHKENADADDYDDDFYDFFEWVYGLYDAAIKNAPAGKADEYLLIIEMHNKNCYKTKSEQKWSEERLSTYVVFGLLAVIVCAFVFVIKVFS